MSSALSEIKKSLKKKQKKNRRKKDALPALIKMKIINNRKTEYDVDPLFPKRWSPRAMSGEEIEKEDLMKLFEAARWAPSSYNHQPWRFVYAMRNTEQWDSLFNLLAEPNKAWCKNAAALIVFVSQQNFEYNSKPNKTHKFSTGSAFENLALQATISGLVCHGMAGFDYEKAREELQIPEGYTVEAMAAIGKPGKKENLPEDLQESEVQSGRKEISKIAFEGKFKKGE